MLEKDCNGNRIFTFPPCYAFQMIFAALAPRLIQSIIFPQTMSQSLNEWITDKAVYRTAPATPGLLMMENILNFHHYPHQVEGGAESGETFTYQKSNIEVLVLKLFCTHCLVFWHIAPCGLTAGGLNCFLLKIVILNKIQSYIIDVNL